MDEKYRNDSIRNIKMGAIYSRLNVPLQSCSGSVTQIIRGRKRKHEEIDSESSDEMSSTIRKSLNTPIK